MRIYFISLLYDFFTLNTLSQIASVVSALVAFVALRKLSNVVNIISVIKNNNSENKQTIIILGNDNTINQSIIEDLKAYSNFNELVS